MQTSNQIVFKEANLERYESTLNKIQQPDVLAKMVSNAIINEHKKNYEY